MATHSNNTTAKARTLGLGAAVASTPPKSQRGQNKPKGKQCGNVARSRCPFEQCKSCCARNQNPCPIHDEASERWKLRGRTTPMLERQKAI